MTNEEVIKKVVNRLMNPDGKETGLIVNGYTFRNPRLELAVQNGLPSAKVGICKQGNGWQFINITKKEGYKLDTNAKQPLPTRINEKEYIKALKSLKAIFPDVGLNLIIVKETGKVNYRIADMEIVDTARVWKF